MELTFGEMLMVGLKRQCLTYQDVADAIGVTKQAVHYYASGRRIPSSISVVECISEMMQLDSKDAEEFIEKYKVLRKTRMQLTGNPKQKFKLQCEYIKELEARIKELEERE